MHKNVDIKDTLYDLCENKGTDHRGPCLRGPVTPSPLPTRRLERFKEVATCQMWTLAHPQVCSGCQFHQDSDCQPPQAFDISYYTLNMIAAAIEPAWKQPASSRASKKLWSDRPPWLSPSSPDPDGQDVFREAGGVSYKKLFQQLCGHLCSRHSTNPETQMTHTRTAPPM